MYNSTLSLYDVKVYVVLNNNVVCAAQIILKIHSITLVFLWNLEYGLCRLDIWNLVTVLHCHLSNTSKANFLRQNHDYFINKLQSLQVHHNLTRQFHDRAAAMHLHLFPIDWSRDYDVIQNYTIRYDMIQYDTIRYDMIQYDMVQHDGIYQGYNKIQYNMIQ